jgi:hypothetical protein
MWGRRAADVGRRNKAGGYRVCGGKEILEIVLIFLPLPPCCEASAGRPEVFERRAGGVKEHYS